MPLPRPLNRAPLQPHPTQVFVDGSYRPELSQLQTLPAQGEKAGWRAGSIHAFADDPALQQELLAEVEWAPEVGMRHTLAAGSLPFTSLNQVNLCSHLVGGCRGWWASE